MEKILFVQVHLQYHLVLSMQSSHLQAKPLKFIKELTVVI